MEYKSYICGSCKYKDVCLTEPEYRPKYAIPICHFCKDGSEYKPVMKAKDLKTVTLNTGELSKASNRLYDLDIASLYQAGPMVVTINSCIKKVIFNNPATIVMWMDGTKTVVKCGKDDVYDPEKGLAMAICKKVFGNKGNYFNVFKKWLLKDGEE